MFRGSIAAFSSMLWDVPRNYRRIPAHLVVNFWGTLTFTSWEKVISFLSSFLIPFPPFSYPFDTFTSFPPFSYISFPSCFIVHPIAIAVPLPAKTRLLRDNQNETRYEVTCSVVSTSVLKFSLQFIHAYIDATADFVVIVDMNVRTNVVLWWVEAVCMLTPV